MGAPTPISTTRREQRTRVLMRGTIYAPSGAATVWIRDISSDGALVSADDPLPAGCDVIFKRGPIFAAAQIAWSKGNNSGVQFYRLLSDEELASAHLPLPNRPD